MRMMLLALLTIAASAVVAALVLDTFVKPVGVAFATPGARVE
jgi:hypothetical protein